MTVGVKAEIKNAVEAFREYSLRAANDIELALEKSAKIVEYDAKKLFKGRDDESVNGGPPRVDTGRLRQSITHRLVKGSDGEVIAEVGTNVQYAVWVEFGTGIYAKNGDGRKTPWVYEKNGKKVFTRGSYPHPFLTPALEMNKSDIEKIIARAIKGAENA